MQAMETPAQVLEPGSATASGEREIVILRLIGAPRELVWKVMPGSGMEIGAGESHDRLAEILAKPVLAPPDSPGRSPGTCTGASTWACLGRDRAAGRGCRG